MDMVSGVLLGLIQGITEWLPISSKSQVTIAGRLMGLSSAEAFGLAVFLHLGTVLAALVYFRREIRDLIKPAYRPLLRFLLIALLGTAIVGLPLYIITRDFLVSGGAIAGVIGIFLVASGILQLVSRGQQRACNELVDKNALALGLAQGFAIIPGVSRSGITVSTLMLESFSPDEAFRISFLLSIPTVLGLEVVQGLAGQIYPIYFSAAGLVGLLTAFVVGYASLDVLLKLAKKTGFAWFAIGFGLLYLAMALAGFTI